MKNILLVLLFLFVSCEQKEPIVKISVIAGDSYHCVTKRGKFICPQSAIWLESIKGEYITTLFVTQFSKNDFGKQNVKRPEALPVWRFKGLQKNGKIDVDSSARNIDEISGATPRGSFTKRWRVPDTLLGDSVGIFCEVNNSFDYNDSYSEKLSKSDSIFCVPNGQPSVIWSGVLYFDGKSNTIHLKRYGHSNVQGKNGNIINDNSSLAGSLSIIKEIRCDFSNTH